MASAVVEPGMVVSFHYTLRSADGVVHDATAQTPFQYLHGQGNLLPELENQLLGRRVGEAFQVALIPQEAFGAFGEDRRNRMTLSEIDDSPNLTPGTPLHISHDDGTYEVRWVVASDDKEVVFTLQHPLATRDVTFDVSIVGTRPATERELADGHAYAFSSIPK